MLSREPALTNESGGVTIVAAILILVILTIIGISATNTTMVELNIAASDQFHKIAFYNADSGLYAAPKIISEAVNTSGPVATGTGTMAVGAGYVAPGTSNLFYRQIMGFDAYDGGVADLDFSAGGISVQVDVRRDRQENIAGGGVEFGSGAEGIGTGSFGGVAVFYDMRADGQGPPANRPSLSNLGGMYRKVVGMAGGL